MPFKYSRPTTLIPEIFAYLATTMFLYRVAMAIHSSYQIYFLTHWITVLDWCTFIQSWDGLILKRKQDLAQHSCFLKDCRTTHFLLSGKLGYDGHLFFPGLKVFANGLYRSIRFAKSFVFLVRMISSLCPWYVPSLSVRGEVLSHHSCSGNNSSPLCLLRRSMCGHRYWSERLTANSRQLARSLYWWQTFYCPLSH